VVIGYVLLHAGFQQSDRKSEICLNYIADISLLKTHIRNRYQTADSAGSLQKARRLIRHRRSKKFIEINELILNKCPGGKFWWDCTA